MIILERGGKHDWITASQSQSDKNESTMRATPFLLIVLDGWGYREDAPDNAITRANTPTWHRLWSEYPHTLLSASGLDVGLPEGQMGNSEVGHMHIGAGRTIYQDLTVLIKQFKMASFKKSCIC